MTTLNGTITLTQRNDIPEFVLPESGNSIWRGSSIYFSMYMVSSAKPLTDSVCAPQNFCKSSALREYAYLSAAAAGCLIIPENRSVLPVSDHNQRYKLLSFVPGTTGTFALIMVFLASCLFPIRRMTSAEGPMKAM